MKIKILYFLTVLIFFGVMNKSFGNYEKTFFDLSMKNLNGENIEFVKYKNKAILIVNVASNCGFTNQYNDLQNLWEKYKDKGLVVLGIPSNQFGGQEPESNENIKKFCEVNFNVNFPMSEKTDVKGENAHPIYLWAKKNYGKATVPKWNFHKILINKNGQVHDTFISLTKPSSKKITNEIEKLLNIK